MLTPLKVRFHSQRRSAIHAWRLFSTNASAVQPGLGPANHPTDPVVGDFRGEDFDKLRMVGERFDIHVPEAPLMWKTRYHDRCILTECESCRHECRVS